MSTPTVRRVAGLLGLAAVCFGGLTCGGGDVTVPTSAINISASSVSFSLVPGASADPQTVSITPATGALSGLEQSISFTGNPPAQWLSAALDDPSATLEDPAILTLQVTTTDLPPGTYQAVVTIRSSNAQNTPRVNVSFTLETATALALTVQPPGTAASGATFSQAPVVQLQTDAAEPVAQPGIEIQVAVEGGGTLAGPASVATDAEGTATFDGLSITAPAGDQSLLFTAAGLTEVRSNPVTITAGTASTIAASSITPQSAEIGTPVNEPPAVLVTDAGGNPVQGVAVTFAVIEGDGVISPTAAVTTGETGIAGLDSWVVGTVPGANRVTASADGLSGSPVEFVATGTAGGVVPGPVSGPNSSVTASPPSFAAGSSGTTITVTARDADNNLIPNAAVVLSSSGPPFTFGSTNLTTGSSGATLGRASTTYTSTKAEGKSISALITTGAVSATPSPANVTVTPGAPSAALSTVTPSPSEVSGLTNASTITITVKDAFGNPISGRPVDLSFVGSDAGGQLTDPSSSTSPAGVATGQLKSTTGGTYQVQATVGGTPSLTITQTASVTFFLTYDLDIEPLFTQAFANALPGGGITTPCSSCHLPYITDGSGELPDLSFSQLTFPVVVAGNAAGSVLILSLEHTPPRVAM
ncbi:MAG: Ig-like domain-containing protein, partial [Gemmatimonadales bacterium]